MKAPRATNEPGRRKRRSRPSLSARLRTYWIVAALGLVCLVTGAVETVRWSGFLPGPAIVRGNDRVADADVTRAAAIDAKQNVWFADTRAMERRIEAIPEIGTARVHRRFPAVVTIEVTERAVDGCVHFPSLPPSADVTVDATRRVLARGCENAAHVQYIVHGTPVIPGRTLVSPELSSLQADRSRLATLGRTFSSYAIDRFGGLVATLPGGIAVRFGDDADLDRKERLIGPVLAAVAGRIALVTAVDVRAPAAPVVDFR